MLLSQRSLLWSSPAKRLLGRAAIPAIRQNAKLDFAIHLAELGREKHPVMLLTMDPSIILLRGTFYKTD
jgi:hypothetical protein